MKRKTYIVEPSTGQDKLDWAVKLKNARILKKFENKTQAIESAKNLAKGAGLGQIQIRGKDGKIQTEYTYGKDPEKYPS